MWYRVFAATDAEIQPAALLEHLHGAGLDVKGHFRGDDQGWFRAELVADGLPLVLERFLVTEEGVRDELNTWAGWVEEQEQYPQRHALMQQIIAAQQVFLLKVPDDEPAESPLHRASLATCRYVAEATEGFYQIDGQGFFTAEGILMLKE